MVDSWYCQDWLVSEEISQVSRRSEVGNHKWHTLNPGYLLCGISQCLWPLHKLPCQSRYEKRTWYISWHILGSTQSTTRSATLPEVWCSSHLLPSLEDKGLWYVYTIFIRSLRCCDGDYRLQCVISGTKCDGWWDICASRESPKPPRSCCTTELWFVIWVSAADQYSGCLWRQIQVICDAFAIITWSYATHSLLLLSQKHRRADTDTDTYTFTIIT